MTSESMRFMNFGDKQCALNIETLKVSVSYTFTRCDEFTWSF